MKRNAFVDHLIFQDWYNHLSYCFNLLSKYLKNELVFLFDIQGRKVEIFKPIIKQKITVVMNLHLSRCNNDQLQVHGGIMCVCIIYTGYIKI